MSRNEGWVSIFFRLKPTRSFLVREIYTASCSWEHFLCLRSPEALHKDFHEKINTWLRTQENILRAYWTEQTQTEQCFRAWNKIKIGCSPRPFASHVQQTGIKRFRQLTNSVFAYFFRNIKFTLKINWRSDSCILFQMFLKTYFALIHVFCSIDVKAGKNKFVQYQLFILIRQLLDILYSFGPYTLIWHVSENICSTRGSNLTFQRLQPR